MRGIMDNLELAKVANEVRKGVLTAVHGAKSGHPGGSLSAADIFTYLYFEEMNIDPAEGRPGSFCSFQGTYGTRSVFCPGT